MEVIVYKLSGCGFCKQLLDALTREGVSHEVRSSRDPEHLEDCEKMDQLFGTRRYPKVVLKGSGKTSFIVTSDGKRMDHLDDIEFYYYNTVDDIINIIKPKL